MSSTPSGPCRNRIELSCTKSSVASFGMSSIPNATANSRPHVINFSLSHSVFGRNGFIVVRTAWVDGKSVDRVATGSRWMVGLVVVRGGTCRVVGWTVVRRAVVGRMVVWCAVVGRTVVGKACLAAGANFGISLRHWRINLHIILWFEQAWTSSERMKFF